MIDRRYVLLFPAKNTPKKQHRLDHAFWEGCFPWVMNPVKNTKESISNHFVIYAFQVMMLPSRHESVTSEKWEEKTGFSPLNNQTEILINDSWDSRVEGGQKVNRSTACRDAEGKTLAQQESYFDCHSTYIDITNCCVVLLSLQTVPTWKLCFPGQGLYFSSVPQENDKELSPIQETTK